MYAAYAVVSSFRGGVASANAMLMLKSLVIKKGWCMVGCPSVNGNPRRIGRIEDVEFLDAYF